MAISIQARNELRRLIVAAENEFERIGDTAAAAALRALRQIDTNDLDGANTTLEHWESTQKAAWRTADHDNWAAAQDAVWARLAQMQNPIDVVLILTEPDKRAARVLKTLMRMLCLRMTRHVTDGGS